MNPLLSRPSPFKREGRWGMGLCSTTVPPHPHPDPPLEGEGEFHQNKD